MDIVDIYKKSNPSATTVGDTGKPPIRYRDKIVSEGSALLDQLNPTKPSTLTNTNPGNYEEQIFEEGV